MKWDHAFYIHNENQFDVNESTLMVSSIREIEVEINATYQMTKNSHI